MIDNERTCDLKLDLSGINRLAEDTFARVRVPIRDGQYSLQELADALCDGWIPYYECHKCGWFKTCSFPQRHPVNSNRAKDIQCGIAVTVLTNCLRAWWPRLLDYERDAVQHFVDALFHLVQFVLDSHIGIGTLVNNWNPEWWGPDMAAHLTASPLNVRQDLEGLAHSLQQVPFKLWKFQVVFVEGEAEQSFLQVLRNHRQLSHVARIEVLGGKGNATPERVPLRLLYGQGYSVSLQLDRDGSRKKSYRALAQRVQEFSGNVFIFNRDFESGFPLPILAKALELSGISVDEAWLQERLGSANAGGIVAAINQKCNCRIRKPDLAVKLGEVVEHNWGGMLHNDRSNEITRWILLLQSGQELEENQNTEMLNH